MSPDYRKQGIATQLMGVIIDVARKDERTHNVVSVITAGNVASQKLHGKFGFTFCGMIPQGASAIFLVSAI